MRLYRSFLFHDLPRLGRSASSVWRYRPGCSSDSDDAVAAESLLDGWQDHAADMTVDVVDDVGHFVPEEAPGLVVELIRSTR